MPTKPPRVDHILNKGVDDVGDGASVYVVECSDCEEVYVGKTGSSISTRLREYKDAVRIGRYPNNSVAKHVHNLLQSIDWEGSKLVYKLANLQQRLIVESTLIK